jgi:predicted SAM-dependent methyltransferase
MATSFLRDLLRPYLHQLRRRRAKPRRYPSETSKCRPRLAPYCQGYGVDLGFGGDPVTPHAIHIDYPQPYSSAGSQTVQLGGDCQHLEWFRDGVLDFVYSSHLLEDFVETEAVLREWLRPLRHGGVLILYCPDEQRFRRHCQNTGQPYNPWHKHADFSLSFVERILKRICGNEVVHRADGVDIYSWELVVRKRTPQKA